jgi:hypothetical protein
LFFRAHDPHLFWAAQRSVDGSRLHLNALSDGALGFQLRNDTNLPARQNVQPSGDAFVNLTVIAIF